jgi:hypothetical protein
MKNLIVTLLSEQTIPNVQFIRYIQEKLKKEDISYGQLFVSTKQMEDKGVGNWICKVCEITNLQSIIVEHNSLSDIQMQLTEKCPDAETYFVNVTGGTKIMSMGVSDFFKEKINARIYYIDGNKCWLNFPENQRFNNELADNINLKEYVESYGFELQETRISGINYEYTKQFLQYFIKFGENDRQIINQIREKRDRTVVIKEIGGLQDFLCTINFPLADKNFFTLGKNEVKYLTGEWFEEYIYFRLNEEKVIKNENLKTGTHLKKNGVDNEFDIIFLYKTRFYAIECKTSILGYFGNLVNETIYKSTALQRNLGLFSNFNIFTLSSKESNDVKPIHLKRANDLNIKVFCREDIMNCEKLSDLLNLNR